MAGQSSLTAESASPIEAAQKGDVAGCLTLLKAAAEGSLADSQGLSALHLAAHLGLEELCRVLIEKGLAVDSLSCDGLTPLDCAASAGQPAICRLLIEKEAEIEHCDASGITPLFRAIARVVGSLNLLNQSQSSVIETCKVLLESGAQTTKNTSAETAVHLVARGHTDLGDDADSIIEQVLSMLLDSGASIDQLDNSGLTALGVAVGSGNLMACRVLLARGADANFKNAGGSTPLQIAAARGRKEIVKLLLESGAEVNHVDDKGLSALHVAARSGHEDICTLLLDAKADLGREDRNGLLALHFASGHGHTGVCSILLERGAALERPTQEGMTALYMAVQRGHTSTCRLLLDHGATANRVVPLHKGLMCPLTVIAAFWEGQVSEVSVDRLELVKVLMEHGADYKMVFEIAVEKNKRELIEAIVLHTSFDPAAVPSGALLRDLIHDLAEWRSMPKNLQEAVADFGKRMVESKEAKESGSKCEGSSEESDRDGKKRKI